MHQLPDGTPLPTEITAVRVDYGQGYAVAAYARDLREQKQMMQDIERRDALLNTGNAATALLLTATDEKKFEESLIESMALLGRCLDVDRVQIWQNEMIDDTLHFVHRYQWLSEAGGQTSPDIGLQISYDAFPHWKEKSLRGECICEKFNDLSSYHKEFLDVFDVKTVIIIPLFLQEKFWGFISLVDCLEERSFLEDEIDILRSVGFLMTSAINRQKLIEQINAEHNRIKALLDATPLACHLWNKDFRVFECNEAMVTLFQLKDKHECFERFFELSPEFQPNGRRSSEAAFEHLVLAFAGQKQVFEWMHQIPDGTPIPAEVTLVRVAFEDDYAVAAYARDLREQKQMMSEIERRDTLLETINQAAIILLQSETDAFENNLYRCMDMMVNALEIDRVSLWKNHTIDGELFCSLVYGRENGAKLTLDAYVSVDVSYKRLPGWEETLSKGNCIAGLVRDMSQEEQKQFRVQNMLSLCAVPIFLRDQFWGYIAYDDCHSERVFSKNEQSILRSSGILIANAILRNEMTLSLRSSAEQLEVALKEAQAANQAKSSFLAHMSHEMRTPLNAVIGLCSLTIENDASDGEIHTNLEKIYNAGIVLLNTVNDILDISKIEAGRFDLQPAEYELASLINDTVTQNITRIDSKPIDFILEIDEDLPFRLYGDELRVKQIFNNLLSNAFKYTTEGTVVLTIAYTREGDDVWLYAAVQDSGIGVHPEDIENLFVDYVRVDRDTNRSMEGTGLGLPLTKKLVEMMDGIIDVESKYGSGSTFTVKLRQKFISEDVLGPEMVKNLKNFRTYVGNRYDVHSGIVRTRMPYARVLVVDDNLTNLDVTQGMMKPYGMKIDCLTRGQQAVDAIREEHVKYNAIFMDHMMPGIDGIEATRLIRSIDTEYAKNIPIIALTANAVVGNENMFLSNGFQAFLPKPMEISKLDEILRHWVKDKEQEEKFVELVKEKAVLGSQNKRIVKERRSKSCRRSGIDRRQLSQKIPGLDVGMAIKRFGKWASYREVLLSFATHTRPLLDEIKVVHDNNIADYAITVHGIKASSRGICAEGLGALASVLEDAAKADNLDLVNKHNEEFCKLTFTMITNIERAVAEIDARTRKPQKAKPDTETLVELRTACENYDMDGVDAAMENIMAYDYESDDGLVAWLQENVEKMNFTEIRERLS
jgi:signal transduction histidine kinase/CheY-like chemotaxis protein/PAS domain-containing protein